MRFAITTLLALGLVSGVACSNRTTTTSANGNTISDSDLKNMIKSKFASDPALAKLDVSANAKKNQVSLSGTVPSERLRTEAVDMAKSVQPNLMVGDKIDVKPQEISRSDYTPAMANESREKARSAGDKIGKSVDDAWLYTKIETKLATNSETPARRINVDVSNNVVTLRGAVSSLEQKKEAERVVRETDGVKGVRNLLKVGA